MDARRLHELMHAVLDGEATPEERDELERWLERDEAAFREYAALRSLFATLAEQPVFEPPKDLVERIAAALPVEPARAAEIPDQLSDAPRVIAARPQRTGWASRLSTIVRWLFQSDTTTTESWTMNANRRIWVGGAAAAAAVGIAMFAFDYPPKSQDVLGTVVPAERYRAPQAGAEAVKLGTPSAATTSAGTDAPAVYDAERVRAEIKAAELRVLQLKAADKVEAERSRTALTEADRVRADRVRAELASAERYLADLRALDLRAAEIKAAEAKVADLKGAERTEADRTRAERVRADLAAADLKLADLRALQLKTVDRVRAERAVADKLAAERIQADRTQADRTQADRTRAERSTDK